MTRTSIEGISAALRSMGGVVRSILAAAVGRAYLALYPRCSVEGVKVVVSDPTVDRKECIDTIQSALALLREVDPRGFGIVANYVRHLLVWPGSYTAYDKWGGVHLAARHVIGVPPALLAGALVHEATHLRIARRGISYEPLLRARIEALCVEAQASSLRKILPDGPAWADEVEAGLRNPWWTESDRRSRVQQSLRDAGLPQWLEPLLYRPHR